MQKPSVRRIHRPAVVRSAALFVVGLIAAAPAARADIIANFTGGNDTTNGGAAAPAPDTFKGIAGAGWASPWSLNNPAGIAVTNTVANTTPVNGGGNYLAVTETGANAAAEVRQYTDVAGDVRLTQKHTVSWDFRIDESATSLTNNFNGGNDRYQFFENPASGSTTATTNNWIVAAFGANPSAGTAGFVAKHWEAYNASPTDNAFTAGSLVDSGIAIASGVTYHFDVTTDPASKTYTLHLTSSAGESFTSASLNWRNFKDNPTAAGGFLQFGSGADASGEARSFALDSVTITAVPEPAAAGLLALFALPLVRRRRRRNARQA
jgi:MYXO-CTERM domain-containing protein